jgi:two-component sensor histidine kinase
MPCSKGERLWMRCPASWALKCRLERRRVSVLASFAEPHSGCISLLLPRSTRLAELSVHERIHLPESAHGSPAGLAVKNCSLQEPSVTEHERLAVVRRYDILDTPRDGAFDRITAIAARALRTPIALISIVDHHRIWFKSRHGFEIEEVGRDPGLCASCILQDKPWIVSDARTDVRALANPFVAGAVGIQFYVGVPLRTHDGFNLGTLCVLDFVPRTVSDGEITQLKDLAAVAMQELELRLCAKEAAAGYHAELARRELREDHIKALMRELAHRTKNVLAVVQAIARETTSDGAASALSGRIASLAYTHDLVADYEWRGAPFRELALRQVSHFVEPEAPRVDLSGPDILMAPAAAQHIGSALHELGANAVQYGALSQAAGKVCLSWNLENPVPGERWLRLSWEEKGAPRVKAPERKRFGSLVLERLAPEGLGGSATLVFHPEGLAWMCDAPAARVIARDAPG